VVISLERDANDGPADAAAIPLSPASLNPYWFTFSGAGLRRWSWKRGR